MSSLRAAAQMGMTLAVGTFIALPAAGLAQSLPYAKMAPLEQYLIADRDTEINLARSAAPTSISGGATILVLTRHGYVTAVQGSNGFTCLVERSWTSPFDSPDFWNWKLRGPVCYNPPASRSVLRYTIFRANMAATGVGKPEMLARLQAAVDSNELPRAEAGSMAYMMSKNQYLGDDAKAWHPHLMFYAPKAAGANAGESWGANRHGSPVRFDSSDHIVPEPWALFFVPVARWSDGSSAATT
jgi:hypothetical protein